MGYKVYLPIHQHSKASIHTGVLIKARHTFRRTSNSPAHASAPSSSTLPPPPPPLCDRPGKWQSACIITNSTEIVLWSTLMWKERLEALYQMSPKYPPCNKKADLNFEMEYLTGQKTRNEKKISNNSKYIISQSVRTTFYLSVRPSTRLCYTYIAWLWLW